MNWDKKKEYTKKRAEALGAEMDKAIAEGDRARFLEAFYKAGNYMKQRDRVAYYKRMIQREVAR